ncbi:phosphoribosylamine--glycine ligase [Thermobifida cellulosilytica]|uniref:Phosphoribosylamine--glycine ligase n=1 Tax=Thermobifida cellulosilytica TB100 TaxID=665004 RepID=A0A147KLG3_THECS|nr:phosphoribosylamine--glycine ligase [Thermobifida cellulosilytica]KUP98160.1 phosphoribosylamine--glycine ligase [Thermobifida cellulosilytica TB100]
MKALVIGGGGREHALVRALSLDPGVTSLHCAPGNPGTSELAENHVINVTDGLAVTELAARIGAELVVIGPEAPLVAGVADELRRRGIPVFGPDQAAARIEGSKAFAKEVMAAAGVPTAASRVCRTASQVSEALDLFGPPYVVKNDGLAAGKGVVVTEDRKLAERHAQECGRVVVEEYLDGPELSLFVLSDGRNTVPLLPAQDFKRAHDGDQGPNTGGMGAYAPLPWAPPGLVDEVMETVVRPTVAELARRGTPYQGLLYAGLALTSRGVRVVEFNARFGDPETQVVLDRLATPLGALLQATDTGNLGGVTGLEWRPGAAVTVVVAAEGYPGTPAKGDLIGGLAEANAVEGAYVLHAGTAWSGVRDVKSNGGRVLSVVGSGADLAEARRRAYEAVSKIELRGSFYRTDIAERAALGQA